MVFDLIKRALEPEEPRLPEINEKIEIQKIVIIESKNCVICNRNLGGMSMYRCCYCGQMVCEDHRLPEKHDCINIMPASSDIRARSMAVTYSKK